MYVAPAGVILAGILLYLGQHSSGDGQSEDLYYWTALVGMPVLHIIALVIGIAGLARGERRLWAWTGIGMNALVLAVYGGFLWLIARMASIG